MGNEAVLGTMQVEEKKLVGQVWDVGSCSRCQGEEGMDGRGGVLVLSWLLLGCGLWTLVVVVVDLIKEGPPAAQTLARQDGAADSTRSWYAQLTDLMLFWPDVA